ncbi:AAA family ATPase [Pseudonocardia sp. GCM10023141]|uniref:AAA family ATPase n=1 Tax=Pseudonocardia sp. GCM10023141 TaxID=3252653 RepID=UPI00360F8208
MTDASHGTTGTLATANRAARVAVAESVTPELKALTGTVQERLSKLGSGAFTNLQPGLDISSASGGGNLALFDGEVPLTNHGLGTRWLAGITTQEMASEDKSVVLIDEIEHGLEPHRLVHLLKHLRSEDRPAQVFTTTHSPVAVEQLNSSDLAASAPITVRSPRPLSPTTSSLLRRLSGEVRPPLCDAVPSLAMA